MKQTDKKALIKKLYAVGKIKKLGNRCYAVPLEAFALGITPRLVSEVLENEKQT